MAREKYAFTDKDPHSLGELARVLYLGTKAVRRQQRGKSTKAIENEIARIREEAQAREDARNKRRR
ncbi:hypothetical protein AB0P12_09475 [Streptomyces subrutilus]|uniref:hypothetical protein n=1 Tax=Streptomyces TaxID=1883 RepID=UPI0024A3BFB0|nr:hypothetical protein [Streptomyces lavendulae]GLV86580.1 hypothetical protein Slala03_62690 [Streptomyces lavendulae subsp. lavendulae]